MLSAPNANCGASPMVAHDKNSRGIANDTKQEVIGEALQVYAAKIAVPKSERFRSLRSLLQIISQLGVKFVSELPRRNPLIVTHDLVDIRINLRMKDEAHQVRRCLIF